MGTRAEGLIVIDINQRRLSVRARSASAGLAIAAIMLLSGCLTASSSSAPTASSSPSTNSSPSTTPSPSTNSVPSTTDSSSAPAQTKAEGCKILIEANNVAIQSLLELVSSTTADSKAKGIALVTLTTALGAAVAKISNPSVTDVAHALVLAFGAVQTKMTQVGNDWSKITLADATLWRLSIETASTAAQTTCATS